MLRVRDLNLKVGDKFILNNINFSVENGEIVGLIGENGAGKSSIFNSCLGLIKSSLEYIELDGEIFKYKKADLRKLRQKLNLVMQDPDRQIFYSLVKDDISFPLKNLGLSEDEIEKRLNEALDALKIGDLKDEYVHYLSFGQKKRVSIAGVMALRPNYIFMDEPTSGLDPRLKRQMIAILREMKKTTGLVVSSHDMDFIYEIADKILVISKGEIIARGEPNDIFKNREMLLDVGLDIPYAMK